MADDINLATMSVKLKGDFSDFLKEINKTVTNIQAINKKMEEFAKTMGTTVKPAVDKTTESFKGISTAAITFGGYIANAMTAATSAFTGFIKSSINSGMLFEKTLSSIKAVTGATTDQMVEMSNQAKVWGSTTVYSANQVASTMELFAKAGYDANTVIKIMPGTLSLAAAGALDLADAANIAVSAINTFGLEATDMAHVADILAFGANETNVEVKELGESLKYAGPIARQLGFSIEETTAALSQMSQYGLKSCYDSETEVLTDIGFKFFKDVKYSDKLLTLNPKNDKLEYHNPDLLMKYEHKDKMYSIKSKNVDLKVTDNHRMYVRLNGRKNFEFVEAAELYGKGYEFKVTGNWEGKDTPYYVLKGFAQNRGSWIKNIPDLTVPMVDWLEFLGYYISEGARDCIKGNYRISICQNIGAKADKIRACLNRLPFNFNEYVQNNNIHFVILNQQVYNEVEKLGKQPVRYVPAYVKELDVKYLRIFYEAFKLGDGTKTGQLFTSSEKLRDDFEEILIKLNICTSHKARPNRVSFIRGREVSSKNTQWVIGYTAKHLTPKFHSYEFTKRNRAIKTSRYSYERWEDYEGFVYCAQVQNNTLFVRRNGKIVVCGNSLAGTTLRQSMMNLINPTKDVLDLLDKHNVSMKNLDGSTKPLVEVIRMLKNANFDAAESFKLLGARGAGLALIMAQPTAEFEKFLAAMTNSTGYADTVAKEKLNNLAGDVAKLGNSLDVLGITIFQAVSPALRVITQDLTNFINSFDVTYITEGAKVIGSGLLIIADNAKVVLTALALIAAYFGGPWGIIAGAIILAATNFASVTEWVGKCSLAVQYLASIFMPFLKELNAQLPDFVDNIKTVVSWLWKLVPFSGMYVKLFDELKNGAKLVGDEIDKLAKKQLVVIGITTYATTFKDLGKTVSSFFSTWGTAFKAAEKPVENLKQTLVKFLDSTKLLTKAVWDNIAGANAQSDRYNEVKVELDALESKYNTQIALLKVIGNIIPETFKGSSEAHKLEYTLIENKITLLYEELQLRKISQANYDIEIAKIRERAAVLVKANNEELASQKIKSEEEIRLKEIQRKRESDIKKKQALEDAKTWSEYITALKDQNSEVLKSLGKLMGDVESSLSDSIFKMIKEGESFKDAMKGFWDSILSSFIKMLADMLAKWLLNLIFMQNAETGMSWFGGLKSALGNLAGKAGLSGIASLLGSGGAATAVGAFGPTAVGSAAGLGALGASAATPTALGAFGPTLPGAAGGLGATGAYGSAASGAASYGSMALQGAGIIGGGLTAYEGIRQGNVGQGAIGGAITGASIAGPAGAIVGAIIGGLGAALNQQKESIQGTFGNYVEGIFKEGLKPEAVSEMGALMQKQGMQLLKEGVFTPLGNSIQQFGWTLEGFSKGTNTAVEVVGSAKEALKQHLIATGGAMDELDQNLMNTIKAFGGTVTNADYFRAAVEKIGNTVNSAGNVIDKNGKVVKDFGFFLDKAGNIIEKSTGQVKNFASAQEVFAAISGKAQASMTNLGNTIYGIGGASTSSSSSLNNIIKSLGSVKNLGGRAAGGIDFRPSLVTFAETEPEAAIPLSKVPDIFAQTLSKANVGAGKVFNINFTGTNLFSGDKNEAHRFWRETMKFAAELDPVSA